MNILVKLFSLFYISFKTNILISNKYTSIFMLGNNNELSNYDTRFPFIQKNASIFMLVNTDKLPGYDMRYPLIEEKNYTEIKNINKNIQKKIILNKLLNPNISILTKIYIINQAEISGLINLNKKEEIFF